jgi:hypothetical protein
MTLFIDISADIESTLRCQLGPELEERAKQDLAVTWFRDGQLTSRQVAAFLGISLFEAHAFLKSRSASLPMSLAEVEDDLAALRESHEPPVVDWQRLLDLANECAVQGRADLAERHGGQK